MQNFWFSVTGKYTIFDLLSAPGCFHFKKVKSYIFQSILISILIIFFTKIIRKMCRLQHWVLIRAWAGVVNTSNTVTIDVDHTRWMRDRHYKLFCLSKLQKSLLCWCQYLKNKIISNVLCISWIGEGVMHFPDFFLEYLCWFLW